MKQGVVLILMFVLLMTACSGQSSVDRNSTAETELVIWVAGNTPQIQETFRAVIDDFNRAYEAQGIAAKVQFEPWGELDQKLTTALAGRVGPDVFMHGAAAAAGFADTGQIEPLDRFFEDWEDLADFHEGYLQAGAVQDQYYVVPIQGANRMMFYRADIFEEVGVTVPETLAELLEVSEKLVIRDGNRFIRAATSLPTQGNELQQIWSGILWSNGGDILNEDLTEATIHSKEAIAAIEWYKSFFDRELTPISGMEGQGDQHPLGTGEIAFAFDGVWAIEQILTYTPEAYEHIKVAHPPKGLQGTTTLVGSSGFFMNANSKYKDEAWQLMSFLANAENIKRVSEELKFLPVRESTANEIQADRLFSEFVELTTTVDGKANPNIPRWVAIRDIISSTVEAAIYGQLTPEDAVRQVELEINNELKR